MKIFITNFTKCKDFLSLCIPYEAAVLKHPQLSFPFLKILVRIYDLVPELFYDSLIKCENLEEPVICDFYSKDNPTQQKCISNEKISEIMNDQQLQNLRADFTANYNRLLCKGAIFERRKSNKIKIETEVEEDFNYENCFIENLLKLFPDLYVVFSIN